MRRIFVAGSLALTLAAGLAPRLAAQIVFQPPTTLPVQFTTQGALAGDLNLDGSMDLVSMPAWVSIGQGSSVSAFIGHGDATFEAPIHTETNMPSGGRGTVASMDGEAFPDLVFASEKVWWTTVTSVKCFAGLGDGHFGPTTGFPSTTIGGLVDVRTVDVTGDGKLDLIVLNTNGTALIGRLQTYAANATVGFTMISDVPLMPGAHFFAVGDVNGDGLPDVVAATVLGNLQVAAGLPGGGFGPASVQHVVDSFTGLALHDLDGDGALDVALTHSAGVGTMLGDGLGGFTLAHKLALGGGPAGLAAGLLDEDDVPDLLVCRSSQNDVAVLRGLGGGKFGFVTGVSKIPSPAGLALADFDADGELDAAVGEGTSTSGQLAVLRNATYAPGSPFTDLGQSLPGSGGYPILLADGTLQGDTKVTLSLANGLPLGAATLVVGLTEASQPFQGGVMVPSPELLIGPLPFDANGELTVVGRWPVGVPSGFSCATQFWFADAAAPTQAASSTGLRAVSP